MCLLLLLRHDGCSNSLHLALALLASLRVELAGSLNSASAESGVDNVEMVFVCRRSLTVSLNCANVSLKNTQV